MFAENPNIFDDVQQSLQKISNSTDIPSPVISRPQTPASTPAKQSHCQTPTPSTTNRRHTTPNSLTKRRTSIRLAKIVQNQSPTVDETPPIDKIPTPEPTQKKTPRVSKEDKRIAFENDLKVYTTEACKKDVLFKDLPRGTVCKTCLSLGEKSDLVKCSGNCSDYVHRKCGPSELKCHECSDVLPVCYACKGTCSDPPLQCSHKTCGRTYHAKCLDTWMQMRTLDSGKVLCPSHVCHTCVSDDPRNKHYASNDTTLTRCIKCPTTFHIDSNCIPAGTKILTKNQHICIRHRKVTRRPRSLSWCYICGKVGKNLSA